MSLSDASIDGPQTTRDTRYPSGTILSIQTVFTLNFASALLLELGVVIAVPGILASIVFSVAIILANPTIPKVTFLALVFIIYALISAIMFGGILSVKTNGLVSWLGGEGRFFLYYWPFIFLTVMLRRDTNLVIRGLERSLVFLTIFGFLTVMVRHAGVQLYSSHHAAGAVLASLTIFNYFRYRANKNWTGLFPLLLALIGLLGTGSRTSVLAAFIGMFIQQIILIRIGQILKIAIVIPFFVIGMSKAFPDQYDRLAKTFTTANPFEVISVNFQRAWLAEPPLESGSAWSLEALADKQGQANLAIRGLLWARGVIEGTKSPIVGTGFGRYNDTGREFTRAIPLVNVVVNASYLNPSTHSSHNTFIMIFAELGLIGVVIISGVFFIIVRKSIQILLRNDIKNDVQVWAGTCLGCVVTLCLTGLTQHSLGAPIYGLSLMQLIAIGYAVVSKE